MIFACLATSKIFNRQTFLLLTSETCFSSDSKALTSRTREFACPAVFTCLDNFLTFLGWFHQLSPGSPSKPLDHGRARKFYSWSLLTDQVVCLIMDDTAKGGLTQFSELFTVIPWAPKDFKC